MSQTHAIWDQEIYNAHRLEPQINYVNNREADEQEKTEVTLLENNSSKITRRNLMSEA